MSISLLMGMKNTLMLLLFCLFCCLPLFGQNYTSYLTGNANDVATSPAGGICLMGGASEDDAAMTWFLQQAAGGDVLVLRTSGSDGYNNYLFSGLGVTVNSVETIVFNDTTAANEYYIHQKVQQAEAIWFAGGDQWDYISYWRNTPIDSLINDGIANRNVVIGGTSAGMAILGGLYFSAENGTVTSATALSNPFDANITVDSTAFISHSLLADVITDTHYDNPDRKGRQVVFLSRILEDFGIAAKGLACDEYTAVCVDSNGIAAVYGGFPTYDDNAYFIQTNCELNSITPENCTPGNPLDWNLGNAAIKVYAVKGTSNGSNTFDLNDWETGFGGNWYNWFVVNGVLFEQVSSPINCQTFSGASANTSPAISVYPNPSSTYVSVSFDAILAQPKTITIKNALGQLKSEMQPMGYNDVKIETHHLPAGIYFLEIVFQDNTYYWERLAVE